LFPPRLECYRKERQYNMRKQPLWIAAMRQVGPLVFCLHLCLADAAFAGGVTVITHGYSSSTSGWVSGMAGQVPKFPTFPGTNFTEYMMSVTYNAGSYYVTTTRTAGVAPLQSDSGEIIVKLDWSQLAGGVLSTYSTYDIAGAVSVALLQTNLISGLNGHAIAEFPMHLIGHSRGGSLVSEISRLLGTNGLWVDHLTTLDPHPLNNDGFSDFPVGVDAPVRTYANVLFHDNYWQNQGDGFLDPIGEPISGAYVRQLYNLDGGYNNTSSVAGHHSNVHLWYHGTLDLATPASDTESSIGSSERSTWWVAPEKMGTNAGFRYSLIAGGNRVSTEQPLGPGFSAIRDGYNQLWDLGAGLSNNRTALPSNSGSWPNLVRLNRMDTNAVVEGQHTPVRFYYQWARPSANQATISLYLDADRNPLNGNETLVSQFGVPGTGASNVSYATVSLDLSGTNAPPGYYFLFGKIAGPAGRSRYFYAPEPLQIVAAASPLMDITIRAGGQIQIGVTGTPGDQIVLEDSSDLVNWSPAATNILSGSRWTIDIHSGSTTNQYFRARRSAAGL
jgi:hypothetical protein